MGKEKLRDLVSRASKDFQLAKGKLRIGEYSAANALYGNAMEKVLSALFIKRMNRNPPKNVSIGYLARNAGVPEDVEAYMESVEENDGMHEGIAVEAEEESSPKEMARRAFYMDGLVQRLLDYFYTYVRI